VQEAIDRLIAEGGERRHAIYILALMLERKKILRPMDSSDPDVLVYEHLANGDTLVVANPRLSLDQIPAVQAEVGALLSGGG
jgi:hypothetical protein